MINFDDYANENKTEHNKKVVIYSRSSKQNTFIEYSNDMQDACNDPKAFNEYSSVCKMNTILNIQMI